MLFFRILRVIITVLLAIFLLITGPITLVVNSINQVIITSSYFGEDLLYSGAYSDVFSYIINNYAPTETASDGDTANPSVPRNLIRSIKPSIFSNIVAYYAASWMKYFLAEVPETKIPALHISDYKDSIHSSAIAVAEDEAFLLTLLKQQLTGEGDSIEDYSSAKQLEMLEERNIKESFINDVEMALNSESSSFYRATESPDPLAIISYFRPELSKEKLLSSVKNNYGILDYYKAIANLVIAGIFACLGILIIIWINNLKVPFFINGALIILSGTPILIISMSKTVFDLFINIITPLIPISLPDMESFNIYQHLAITPVIDHIRMTSGFVIVTGLVFILFGMLANGKKKRPKKIS